MLIFGCFLRANLKEKIVDLQKIEDYITSNFNDQIIINELEIIYTIKSNSIDLNSEIDIYFEEFTSILDKFNVIYNKKILFEHI